ncbi:MAG: hypothetical protein QXV62_00745 [Nitrososphaerota archaeon]
MGYEDEVKCGGCNWEVTRLYVLADTEEEAVELVRMGEAGLWRMFLRNASGEWLGNIHKEIISHHPLSSILGPPYSSVALLT